MEKTKIVVSGKHINKGEPMFCDCCAVALALYDIFTQADNIEVRNASYIRIDGVLYKAEQKDVSRVNVFLERFDYENGVAPMEFYLVKA